jgi:hydroxymethylbilane synthase
VTDRPIRLGTRRSALALAQSRSVADAITTSTGRRVELVEITTYGDRSSEALATIGGTGVFVSALRDALLDGDIDLAVHSYKDLPTKPADGLVVAAVPVREDARDVLVARNNWTLADLAPGSRIGTGSPRRMAQLRALGYGLDVEPIRGNVDTRLRKVAEGEVDAVVLAYAGLSRLGRLGEVTEVLDPLQMLPAPAQGALAVECRLEDPVTIELLSDLDDTPSRAAVTAERALLAALEAGCSAPVGALAEIAEGDDEGAPEIYLRGVVVSVDGSTSVRLSTTGSLDDAEVIGRRLAADLLAEGASDVMGERVP